MVDELNSFVAKIPDFKKLSASECISLFLYYLSQDQDRYILPSEIRECFEKLSMIPYSNIPAYLNSYSKGKGALFIKNKSGYKLTRSSKENVAAKISNTIIKPITNDFIPLSLLENTRNYIQEIARQMCCCYDLGLSDASLVMLRKLLETLIIECFERFGISEQIQDKNRHFLFLSDLIPLYVESKSWNTSRNLKDNIKTIKTYGDLSAHNRRFIAQREDLNKIKFEARQVIQEIILTIDYPTWNQELALAKTK